MNNSIALAADPSRPGLVDLLIALAAADVDDLPMSALGRLRVPE